ncbi:MAG: asparagine synthase (glutamine-hydrolyzing) [Chromatiales bacterium]|nr:MAG: asparagine synthase (glutamine-hydrolyzing) [Chromatiales bacterium]
MCGIAGTWGAADLDRVASMAALIGHRGPDDSGVASVGTANTPVALAHKRLSIIDLSEAGQQPMCNEDGAIWVTYNGEIYNFQTLRAELLDSGHRFKSNTDTEILVHAYEEWGMDFVARLNGIFAFALWDANRETLYLCRDRLGVKPLYYHLGRRTISFASEIKSLLVGGDISKELDPLAVLSCAAYRYCPEPMTLLADVRKLSPGTWLQVQKDGATAEHRFHTILFDPDESLGEEQTAEQLRGELTAATRRQMISDVPVGMFLSGGLDSSGLLALAREFTDERFKSFTIGFRQQDSKGEGQPDDLGYARLVAKTFGTDHHEIILDPKIVELLPKVVYHLDEPIADPAAITSYLICEQARQQDIKVLLSGQGADEVFCGYPWHLGGKLARDYARIPAVLRSLVQGVVQKLPAHGAPLFPGASRRLRKFVGNVSDGFESSMLGFLTYAGDDVLNSLFTAEFSELLRTGEQHWKHRECLEQSTGQHYINRMLDLDLKTFLPSLNLTYTDKTSMAHGVEVRVPYIDNEIIDFAAHMPPRLKLRGNTRKWILKKALEPLLPRDVVHRRKAGFGAPIRTWVARDLQPMIADLLSAERLRKRGVFSPKGVQEVLRRNASGSDDFAYLIYFLISFELWCESFLEPSG